MYRFLPFVALTMGLAYANLDPRAMEELMSLPLPLGDKLISGGAGEGIQTLADNIPLFRQDVKTDKTLPAYCHPPNPCPVGYTENDGCVQEFENTAEFSQSYQASQDCMCDQEHMFSCGGDMQQENPESAIEELLSANNIDHHQGIMAKKFYHKE